MSMMRSVVTVAGAYVVLSAILTAGGAASASQHRAVAGPTAPVFQRAVEIRLPAGGDSGILRAVECLSRGACVAGGLYFDRNGLPHPMIVTETGGRWAQARGLRLPQGQLGEVTAIDCTGLGNCVAGGDYEHSVAGRSRLFAVTERAGMWGRISTFLLPGNTSVAIALGAIACPRPGFCEAVGTYDDTRGSDEGWAATERAGRWQQAREIQPPTGANAIPNVDLYSLSCSRPGSCVATGLYFGRPGGARALAVTEASGQWRRAVQVLPPPGADSPPFAALFSVTCPRPGTCEASGGYSDASGQGQKMVAAKSGGLWRRAQAVNVWPPNASFAIETDHSFKSMACPALRSCVAVAPYIDTAGGKPSLVATESGGTWARATEMGLPANAAAGASLASDANAVDCTSTGYCAIVGDYADSSRIYQALADTTR